jgi:adenine specific DNA methylase Mod
MTEVIWEGKYKDGKKAAPVNIALPFQNVETVNESTQQRQTMLDLFSAGKDTEWRNRLIWGDKKYVLPSLLPEFAGKINLIYIDPPFDTGADFSFTATIPDNPETEENEGVSFVKEPSIIEQKAYRDTWGKGLDSYLQWFYETALLLRELLSDDGSIYVHLDYHVVHYVKTILDEVFGYQTFLNEIIWRRKGGSALGTMNRLSTNTDTILLYSKTDKYKFHMQYEMPSEEYIEQNFSKIDENGRRFQATVMRSPNPRPNLMYDYKGYKMPPNGWAIPITKMKELDRNGYLYFPDDKSKQIYKKIYLDEYKGQAVNNLWNDIATLKGKNIEILNYDTQKPETLLERVIKLSSDKGDLVLDCFSGSGTTAATAEKLNRRWITCDLGRFAIHTTRKRLLQIPNVKPFVVQNLGKYERQQWIAAEFHNPDNRLEQEKAYREFIIGLYHAQPVKGYVYLHGAKAGRMVHVGAVDAPVSMGDVKAIINEFWQCAGKKKEIARNGIDVLGWDFAFEINETSLQFAAANKIDLKFKKIPREVLEKKAVEQGDIKFFEMASLNVTAKKSKFSLTVTLENFIVPPDDVPQEVQKNITHWSQWIDYWAIDWDYKNDTFHNQWQSYRSRQNPAIELSASYVYEKKGKYSVLVKVIDILGNDTTKMLAVEL